MNNCIELFGIKFALTNLRDCSDLILSVDKATPKYVCLPDMFVVSCAYQDEKLRSILNNSFLTLPDGKPIQFFGRMKGIRNIRTVSGYWLIMELMRKDLSHYFYGADHGTVAMLVRNLKKKFPDARIVGYKSPPLLSLENIGNHPDLLNDMKEIRECKPDIIWLGISSPKQDYLAHYYHTCLDHGIMIAVGGVFDYIAGRSKKSPEWVKKIGMRWFYRLIQEPGRLWPKYSFIFKTLLTAFFKRSSPR
jgi:N-acetylglucosaminyldiphosphoundecaprenol N-acetyl-beta-D-mannosaminyltransferase